VSRETVIHLADGKRLRCPAHPAPCEYIRVTNSADEELAYWTYAEWQQSPMHVIGALCRVLAASIQERGKPALSTAGEPESPRLDVLPTVRQPARYLARFHPCSLVGGRLIEVSAEGPCEWDATEVFAQRAFEICRGAKPACSISTYRWLKAHPSTPEWIRRWIGLWRISLHVTDTTPVSTEPRTASPTLLTLKLSENESPPEADVECTSTQPPHQTAERPGLQNPAPAAATVDPVASDFSVGPSRRRAVRSRGMLHVGVLIKVSYDAESTDLGVEQHTHALIRSLIDWAADGVLTQHDNAAVVDDFQVEPHWRQNPHAS
jgi:hypothetical protein